VAPLVKAAKQLLREGQVTFRYETFGDEEFWGGTLKLHQAIAGAANGGTGAGLSPKAALDAGLKLDVDALGADLKRQLATGNVNLDDPANTLTLLRKNAVVGVTGFFDDQGTLTSVGLQCAFCHSTVDDDFAPGIGHRRDGWANRDLNVGAIVALAPDLSYFAGLLGVSQDDVRKVLKSWGPGKFDAELAFDGKATAPSGVSGATLIPPAFGLAGVNLHTWTGWARSRTGTRSWPCSRCTARATSSTRASTTPPSSRSRPRMASATWWCPRTRTASRPGSRACTSTSSRSRRRRLPRAASIRPPPSAATSCSAARRTA
jgi:hypothetical protein